MVQISNLMQARRRQSFVKGEAIVFAMEILASAPLNHQLDDDMPPLEFGIPRPKSERRFALPKPEKWDSGLGLR